MLPAILTVLFWIPAIVGLGSLLRYEGERALRIPIAGMLGLLVLAVAAVTLNFAVALGPAVSLAAWAAGTALLVRHRRWLREGLSPWDCGVALASLPLLVLLTHAPSYDAGLYYIQSVKWAAERRIEVGLGNLHVRLAMNSVWFPMSALLEHPLAAGRSKDFVSFLPAVLGIAAASAGARTFLAGDRRFSNLFLAATILPVASGAFAFGSQSPDQVLGILSFVVLALWARALEPGGAFAAEAHAALLLALLGTLVKLSGAPLVVGGVTIALARRRDLDPAWLRRAAVPASLAVSVWAARSVLLSGCLLLPVAGTCIPGLPWGLPPERVEGLSRAIAAWARSPGSGPEAALGGWGWLEAWAERAWAAAETRALAVAIAGGAVAWASAARRTTAALAGPFLVAALGTALWFFSAPDPRFALGYLYALALLPIAFAAARAGAAARTAVRAAMVALVLAASAYVLHATDSFVVANAVRRFVPVAGWPPLPVAPVAARITAGGYRASVPLRDDRCWAVPIPCTPELDERLGRTWALVRLPGTAGSVP